MAAMAIAEVHATPPTAPDTTATDFREQINREVAHRMPNAVILFMAMMIAAFAIEWAYHPDRIAMLMLCTGTLTATCAVGVWVLRQRPDHAAEITISTVLVLAIVLALYLSLIERSSELCLLAMIGYLTGLVVQFPWGPRYQAAAAVGVWTVYALTLLSPTQPHLPVPYGLFALTTHGIMTVLGASLLDRYRWSAFSEAAEAEKMAAQAARANRAKSDFLATVSHELRTPLNIIFGYIDLLIDDAFPTSAERTDALRRVRSQSGNLLDMIQAMLDINKLEAGGVMVDTAEFRLGEFMTHLQTAVPATWCKDGVALVWESDGGSAVMESDPDKIEIVLRNLIHNALKYTDRGEVRVRATAKPGNCNVAFTVSDTGQGIPPDDLERIFQMFHQSANGPPRQGGVGLGLFLARQLTGALGGEISAESEIGNGARFTVRLPLKLPTRHTHPVRPE